MSSEANKLKIILSEVIERLLEYSETHNGKLEGLMAYDLLLTIEGDAQALDVNLEDIGLNKDVVHAALLRAGSAK